MDRARDELLAGAARAEHEHRTWHRGDALDLRHHGPHRGRVAHYLPAPPGRLAQALVGRSQLAVLFLEPLAIQRVLQDALDFLDGDLELVLEVWILGDEVD